MKKKQTIITFKVDGDLLERIESIPNRSEFIRGAIIAALGVLCPLCNGSGMLTPNQKRHWDNFTENHIVKKCDICHESFLVCQIESQ